MNVQTVIAYAKSVAKAIGAGVAAGLTYLIGVISVDASIGQAFSTMTFVQWAGLVLAVLAAYGVVWRVPNVPIE